MRILSALASCPMVIQDRIAVPPRSRPTSRPNAAAGGGVVQINVSPRIPQPPIARRSGAALMPDQPSGTDRTAAARAAPVESPVPFKKYAKQWKRRAIVAGGSSNLLCGESKPLIYPAVTTPHGPSSLRLGKTGGRSLRIPESNSSRSSSLIDYFSSAYV